MGRRQRFECVNCHLRISGVLRDGQIYAYDRSPDGDGPVIPCLCAVCAGIDRPLPLGGERVSLWSDARACPECDRIMSEREYREQRICNDCAGVSIEGGHS